MQTTNILIFDNSLLCHHILYKFYIVRHILKSLKKNWETPPEKLLHLVKAICEKGNFYSMSVDIFETKNNEYLVNELQCIFGQSTPHLMLKNGLPGRFYFDKGKNTFQFEEGDFNKFNSKLLRVEHFINILKAKDE